MWYLSFVLPFVCLSTVNICPSIVKVQNSECSADGKCSDQTSSGICCEGGRVAKLETFRSEMAAKAPSSGCRGLFDHIFRTNAEAWITGESFESTCTRKMMLQHFNQESVVVLSASLNILMAVPRKNQISIPYVTDSEWQQLEDMPAHHSWTLKMCKDNAPKVRKEEPAELGKIQYHGEILPYVFYLFCSMGLFDTYMTGSEGVIPKDAAAVIPIYAHEYLKALLELHKDDIYEWGNLPRVLAQFVHMAAVGAFDEWHKIHSCDTEIVPFVPTQLMNL